MLLVVVVVFPNRTTQWVLFSVVGGGREMVQGERQALFVRWIFEFQFKWGGHFVGSNGCEFAIAVHSAVILWSLHCPSCFVCWLVGLVHHHYYIAFDICGGCRLNVYPFNLRGRNKGSKCGSPYSLLCNYFTHLQNRIHSGLNCHFPMKNTI